MVNPTRKIHYPLEIVKGRKAGYSADMDVSFWFAGWGSIKDNWGPDNMEYTQQYHRQKIYKAKYSLDNSNLRKYIKVDAKQDFMLLKCI